jgi:hypothetical protein
LLLTFDYKIKSFNDRDYPRGGIFGFYTVKGFRGVFGVSEI